MGDNYQVCGGMAGHWNKGKAETNLKVQTGDNMSENRK